MKIIGYIVLLLLILSSVTALLQSLISSVIRIVIRNLYISLFMASIIVWVGICLLWYIIYKENIPIALFGCSILLLIIYSKSEFAKLLPLAKTTLIAEFYSIIIVGVSLIIFSQKIIWY